MNHCHYRILAISPEMSFTLLFREASYPERSAVLTIAMLINGTPWSTTSTSRQGGSYPQAFVYHNNIILTSRSMHRTLKLDTLNRVAVSNHRPRVNSSWAVESKSHAQVLLKAQQTPGTAPKRSREIRWAPHRPISYGLKQDFPYRQQLVAWETACFVYSTLWYE